MSALSVLRPRGGLAPPPPVTVARTRLAESIANRDEMKRDRAQLEAAHAPSFSALVEAERALEGAQEALRTALAGAVSHRIAQLGGDAAAPVESVSAARLAEQNAADNVAAAREIRREIERRIEASGTKLPNMEERVAVAARAVMVEEGASAVANLARDIAALQNDLVLKGLALQFHLGLRAGTSAAGGGGELSAVQNRLGSPPNSWTSLVYSPECTQLRTVWEAVLASLRVDANAPVPK